MTEKWIPVEIRPIEDREYLVFMPNRSLDRFSVQHYDRRDGWTNNFGITHWAGLPKEPSP